VAVYLIECSDTTAVLKLDGGAPIRTLKHSANGDVARGAFDVLYVQAFSFAGPSDVIVVDIAGGELGIE
jgi:hypothetical protein